MLAIDLVAVHLHSVNDLGTGSYCMFTYTRKNVATRLTHPVLEMHWAVRIPPNALLRIGPPIITATVFEFTQVRSKPSLYERSSHWCLSCYNLNFKVSFN